MAGVAKAITSPLVGHDEHNVGASGCGDHGTSAVSGRVPRTAKTPPCRLTCLTTSHPISGVLVTSLVTNNMRVIPGRACQDLTNQWAHKLISIGLFDDAFDRPSSGRAYPHWDAAVQTRGHWMRMARTFRNGDAAESFEHLALHGISHLHNGFRLG